MALAAFQPPTNATRTTRQVSPPPTPRHTWCRFGGARRYRSQREKQAQGRCRPTPVGRGSWCRVKHGENDNSTSGSRRSSGPPSGTTTTASLSGKSHILARIICCTSRTKPGRASTVHRPEPALFEDGAGRKPRHHDAIPDG